MTKEKSLADQAYDEIERMIVTLELAPGTLFSEGDLSRQIGIGRTPLREALQRLANDRLVIALARRGMMVTSVNASEYLSLLDTRAVLDRLIARHAAGRATPRARHALGHVAEGIVAAAAASDEDAFMRQDRAGDDLLEHACRNPYAFQAASSLHAHSRRFWSMYRHFGDLKRSAGLHASMLTAVSNANVDAAGNASDALIDYLETFTRTALDLD